MNKEIKNLRKGMKVRYSYLFRPTRNSIARKRGTGLITGIKYRSELPITINNSFRIRQCEITSIAN